MRLTPVNGNASADATWESLSETGSAVPRLTLGERLRRLREGEYITRTEAAEAIRVTRERMTEMECGRAGFRPRDVRDLLNIYGVSDGTERATLLALADRTEQSGWWQAYRDVVPDWLHNYLAFEQVAGLIRSYEVQFVPGLLQTEAYARAVTRLDPGEVSVPRLERRVELRMLRQRILRGPRPPHLWAVIDEAALRRPVGGAEIMREQLEQLIAACDMPHVTIQVLPFRAGGHPAAGGPVTMLRLREHGLPDTVFLEQLRSGHYPDDPEDIKYYRDVINRLATQAEPSTRTKSVLRRVIEQGWAVDGPMDSTYQEHPHDG